MANILLVDPSEVARKALQGILARGGHCLACANSASEAIALIHRNVRVDLIFTELRLPGEGGLALVRQLKAHRLLKLLPIVIYTEHGDRDTVKHALDLRVQNFLIKPFHDEDIFAEIQKADANPWRARHFEEEKSFCRLMGITPTEARAMLEKVRDAIPLLRYPIEHAASVRDHSLVAEAIMSVRDEAEVAGAWAVVETLNQISDHTSANQWGPLPADLEQLDFARDLLSHWIDPQRECPDYTPATNAADRAFALEKAAWLAAPAANTCPIITRDQLYTEIASLNGCPVVDSAAAAFQMVANGHPSCINPLMDIVARDPGLMTEMLIAANRVHPASEDFNRIEDPRLAVGQLGEFRLQEEANRLVVIEGRTFAMQPALSWASYWTFQRAVARIAQLICRDLEFYSLEATARTAGQMHDIGLLLLARLHPAGFQAILDHARINRQPLREVEKLFLGCTTPELACRFAEQFSLSRRFANVLRWIDRPAEATEDRPLVAIISLARSLCRHNEVGTCGDIMLDHPAPLEETPEWAILSEGLYPSFNLRKFELKVHGYCSQLRAEFSGHEAGTIRELIERSAAVN